MFERNIIVLGRWYYLILLIHKGRYRCSHQQHDLKLMYVTKIGK